MSGAGTTNVAGNLVLIGGDSSDGTATNETGGDVIIRGGSGGAGTGVAGSVALQTAGETTRFEVDDTGIAFFNGTTVAQQNGTGETTGFVAGSGTGVNDDSTFTGNVGSTAYRISDVVKALKNYNLLAA